MEASLTIIDRLARATDDAAREVSVWLTEEDAKPLYQAPANVTVHEAFHIWRLRHQNSVDKGSFLKGSDVFLSRLKELTPQKKLEQFTFASSSTNGNIFFEKASGDFVGAVLVRRKGRTVQLKKGHALAAVAAR